MRATTITSVLTVFAVSAALTLAGCDGHPEVWEVTEELSEFEQEYEQVAQMFRDLGIDISQTPALDPNGNPLPEGFNPLHAAPLNAIDTTLITHEELLQRTVSVEDVSEAYLAEINGTSTAKSASLRGLRLGSSRAASEGESTVSVAESFGGSASIGPLYEIYVTGLVGTAGKTSVVYQNFDKTDWPSDKSELQPIKFDADISEWNLLPKKAIRADVNGDGRDDVIIVIADLEAGKVTVRMGSSDSSEGGFTSEIGSFPYPGGAAGLKIALPADNKQSKGTDTNNEFQHYGIDLAAGDLDWDGKKEVLVVIGGRMFILSGLAAPASFAYEEPHAAYDISDKMTIVSIASADFNNDGHDDWIEAVGTLAKDSGALYTIYDGVTKAVMDVTTAHGQIKAYEIAKFLSSVNVITGDFDGDGLYEAAFCGKAHDSNGYRLFILETEMDSDSKPVFTMMPTVTDITVEGGAGMPGNGALIPALAAADMKGDQVDHIFAVNNVYSYDASSYVVGVEYTGSTNDVMYDLVDIGDVNGDLLPDVVYLDWEKKLNAVTINSSGSFTHKPLMSGGGFASIRQDALRAVRGQSGGYDAAALMDDSGDSDPGFPAYAMADVTIDGCTLKYLGHDVRFDPPTVVAVIASPPYYKDVTYANPITHLSTVFGKISGEEEVMTHEHSFQNWVYGGAIFTIGSHSARLTGGIRAGGNWGFSNSTETVVRYATAASAGEDVVVYSSVGHDVYYYLCTYAAPGNSRGFVTGGYQEYSYVRPAMEYHQNLEYYNEHNGSEPDVVVPHTVGMPFTYTPASKLSELKYLYKNEGIFGDNDIVHTGRSDNGWTTQSTETLTTETTHKGWTQSQGVNQVVEGTPFGKFGKIFGSILLGWSGTYYSRVNWMDLGSEGLWIEGNVPDVPLAATDKSEFLWGIMMYPTTQSNGNKYQNVTYWVDENN